MGEEEHPQQQLRNDDEYVMTKMLEKVSERLQKNTNYHEHVGTIDLCGKTKFDIYSSIYLKKRKDY